MTVPSFVYGIITIIIVVFLIIACMHFSAQSAAEATILHYTDGETKLVNQHPTLQDAYANFRGDLDPWGERPLSHGEALVMYGHIPKTCAYWGITGYLYKWDGHLMHASLGDPVSSASIASHSGMDGVAVVLTYNVHMFNEVHNSLTQEWNATSRKHLLHVYPMYIPHKMYLPGATYTLQSKVLMHRPGDPIPQFKCRIYTSPNITQKAPFFNCNSYKDRSHAPKEHDVIDEVVWHASADDILAKQGYVPLREIPVRTFLDDEIRDGLNHGADAMDKRLYCHADNRDITRFMTPDFTVAPDESIAVISIDHAMSKRGQYSSVTFYNALEELGKKLGDPIYATYTTGDALVRKHNQHSTLKAQVTVNNPPPHIQKVRCVEHIYVEPTSDIGPGPDSVLPMRVFIIKRVELH
ncbi:Hypothetical protein POVN_LOCUS525 [uncultured virus]|nr:Hypothetical protein POVN_LOCUS525 [uncultured virus]